MCQNNPKMNEYAIPVIGIWIFEIIPTEEKPTWAFITIDSEEMTIIVYLVDLFSAKPRLTSRSNSFCRRHFQMHFRVWTLLCFDLNVTEFCNHASNKQTVGIGTDHAWNPLFEPMMAQFT